MCGIAGIASRTDASARVEAMTATLVHRGPDDEGLVHHDGVVFGHRRLSVIDLSANGHQPMTNEDGSVWITYNGELYDTQPTRDWLERRGHRFVSRTDTEVLVHLYEELGCELFAKVNGMFAFVIHDLPRRRLLLARDRLGIKPLYYAVANGELVFGSELPAVLCGLAERPALSPHGLGQYFLQGYVSAPDTIYRGVRLLPPGHYLEVSLDDLWEGRTPEPVEYWDAQFTGDDDRSVERIESDLEELLYDAVRIRMVSDVPFGAFLSGGIDSSSVVALMAKASNVPVRTFTVDVPGTDRSEREKARAVARMHETDHVEIDATQGGANDYWPRLEHFGAPFNCPSLLNTWLVSRAARQYVTVALSGDGGDELFGGYERHQRFAGWAPLPAGRSLLRAGSRLLPADLRGRAKLDALGNDACRQFLSSRHPLPIDSVERLVGVSLDGWDERMQEIFNRYPSDAVTRATYFDLKTYMPDHVLAKVDSASMAVSLEVRVPMLDYRVVELAGRIPASLKIRDGRGKWILKRLARRWLPAELLEQRKVGFDPPLAGWVFDSDLSARLDELESADARYRSFVDTRLVDRWIRTVRTGSSVRVPQRASLWALYQFERWLEMQ